VPISALFDSCARPDPLLSAPVLAFRLVNVPRFADFLHRRGIGDGEGVLADGRRGVPQFRRRHLPDVCACRHSGDVRSLLVVRASLHSGDRLSPIDLPFPYGCDHVPVSQTAPITPCSGYQRRLPPRPAPVEIDDEDDGSPAELADPFSGSENAKPVSMAASDADDRQARGRPAVVHPQGAEQPRRFDPRGAHRRITMQGMEAWFGEVIVPKEQVTEFKRKTRGLAKLYPGTSL